MITQTEKGLHCASGGFYIDPSRAVDLALITHAHSDHARRGSRHYICEESGISLLKSRLGSQIQVTGVRYGQKLSLGQLIVSFHPAGHILGSAQIRVESEHSVWVASGDYKREPDPTCAPFEVVPCDTFITEATFGNPVYEWRGTSDVFANLYDWWQMNRARGVNSLLYCYALGKTQRVLAELARFTQSQAYTFGEAHDITECYRAQAVPMLATQRLEDLPREMRLKGELIVAPHSISRSGWLGRLGRFETAFASGWMSESRRGFGFRGGYDRGFAVSDHADWPSLVQTVRETGARQVFVLHASSGHLVKYLKGQGIIAASLDRPRRAASASGLEPLAGKQGELF